jgi:hypothetical protein
MLKCTKSSGDEPAAYRVRRVAYAATYPPCGCSHEEPYTVWEGADPSGYTGGLGAFDEGCHHPNRWMEVRREGVWHPL